MSDPLLRVEGLEIGFGARTVLRADQFAIERGRMHLLTGPSGSGKSVLLAALLGLLPVTAVRHGRFRWHCADGNCAGGYADYVAAQPLQAMTAVLFQDAVHSLHPYQSIARQCPYPDAALRDLRLQPEYLTHPRHPRFPKECSGGECQRLNVLHALHAQDRDLVILDEPLTDIDRISRQDVGEALRRLMTQAGKTVLVATHEISWLRGLGLCWYRLEPLGSDQGAALRYAGDLLEPADPSPAPPLPWQAEETPFLHFATHEPILLGGHHGFPLLPIDGVELRPGERLGLAGESGSGKSSLLRILGGLGAPRLYRDTVDYRLPAAMHLSPAVDPSLHPVRHILPRTFYRHVQLVSQDSGGAFIGAERVGAHLDGIRRSLGVDSTVFDANVLEWGSSLDLFSDAPGLAALRERRHRELSMGMRRRYAVLKAFMLLDIYSTDATPKLLLLDEVSRGLDADRAERLADTIDAFSRRHRVAVLAVSHDLGFLARLCGRVRLMYRGALLPASLRLATPVEETRLDPATCGPNPYYRHFLIEQRDLPRKPLDGRAPLDHTGCWLARWCECESSGTPECCDQTLQNQGVIGICA